MTQVSWLQFFAQTATLLPAILIAITFHEFAHAVTATLLGDNTPKRDGRLTLNPLVHIDFLGLLFLIFFRFGWAKPVVIDLRNFKYPRLFDIITSIAGPISNFLIALIAFVSIKHFPETIFNPAINTTFLQLLETTAFMNIVLGVFNLFPIPPLDGSHIITTLLAKPFPRFVSWLHQYSLFILILFLFIPQVQNILLILTLHVAQILKNIVF
jgi:Zn-dependent protease